MTIHRPSSSLPMEESEPTGPSWPPQSYKQISNEQRIGHQRSRVATVSKKPTSPEDQKPCAQREWRELPVWRLCLVIMLVSALVVYFCCSRDTYRRTLGKQKLPPEIHSANEYEPYAKELQSCKTTSYDLVFSCIEVVNSNLEYQKHAADKTDHIARTKHARDLHQCDMLLDQEQRKLEGLHGQLKQSSRLNGRR
ncbi:hypothetical protein HO133_001936 [Letharia lupina]|uniref:Uncharacterized protein n=1 Tax=Letharia lupina TaxID=560253 RepID=A0A8H6CEC1_9LECA|nr:uncharacterized protein HO133_001936 [Letharia lupina]KAF6221968.1 hypothetical protein HO133_001936 [Letharia lupina]